MNREQAMKLVRWGTTTLGGILIGWAASRGYQWGNIINSLLSSEFVIGLLVSGVVAFWSWASGKAPNLVAIVNSLSGVQGVITTRNPEGVKLAEAVPSPTVVPAGTLQAGQVAQAAPIHTPVV